MDTFVRSQEKLREAAREENERLGIMARDMVRAALLNPATEPRLVRGYLPIARQYDREWVIANQVEIDRAAKHRKPAKRGPKPGKPVKAASRANLIPGPHKGRASREA